MGHGTCQSVYTLPYHHPEIGDPNPLSARNQGRYEEGV